MPIAYVALILGVAAWFAASATPRRAAIPTGASAPTPSLAKAPTHPPSPSLVSPDGRAENDPEAPARVAAPTADPILRNAQGLRRKVLVRELGLRAFDRAVGGRASGPPLDYFSIQFLHGQTAPGPEPRLEVGPASGPSAGWVPARSVLEWDTRLMARPTRSDTRSRTLTVYLERSCLLDAMAGRACQRHATGQCPIEAEEPTHSGGSPPTPLGMPVLKSELIPQPNGPSRSIHEVAVLVRDLLPLPAPTEPPVELRQPLQQVYIAFVVDTTRSMEIPIAAVRDFARRLAEEAAGRDPRLVFHLALVEYRDRSPIFGFETRRVTDFTAPAEFRSALDTLASAKLGDNTPAEAVMAGVAAALPPAEGQPGPGGSPLGWPTGRAAEAATKLILLLGDAPDHEPGIDTAMLLAAQAREHRITIAAVGLEPPPERRVLSRSERQRYQDQWQALAEGSFRPIAGHDPMPPLRTELHLDADAAGGEAAVRSVADRIGELVQARVALALEEAARVQAEAERRLVEYRDQQSRTLEAVAPVLVDSHSREARPRGRPDPRAGGVRAPSLRRGWIAEQWGSDRLVSLGVLMSRPEVDRLVHEYLGVQVATQAAPEEVARLIEIGTAAAAGETAFLEGDRGDLTFDEHLRRWHGLPPGRSDSLLRRSRQDFLQADVPTRAALADRLSAAIGRLVRFRDAGDWNDPTRSVDGLLLVPYEWIDL